MSRKGITVRIIRPKSLLLRRFKSPIYDFRTHGNMVLGLVVTTRQPRRIYLIDAKKFAAA